MSGSMYGNASSRSLSAMTHAKLVDKLRHPRRIRLRGKKGEAFGFSSRGGWLADVGFLIGLVATAATMWLGIAAQEIHDGRIKRQALHTSGNSPDRMPDVPNVAFDVFWSEVDPGESVVSENFSVNGVSGPVRVFVEGEGNPQISVDGAGFVDEAVFTAPQAEIRVRMRAPSVLGGMNEALLHLGEQTTTVVTRSRKHGAFAFDRPSGSTVSSIPVVGKMTKIDIGLSTVENPELSVDWYSSRKEAVTFDLADNAIWVMCSNPPSCEGNHDVGFTVEAVRVSRDGGGNVRRLKRRIESRYILDLSGSVNLDFATGSDLGTVEAANGIIARIDLVANNVQGTVVEMTANDSRGGGLRFARDGNEDIVVICTNVEKCVGRRTFAARVESWNPYARVSRDFVLRVEKPVRKKGFLSAPQDGQGR